MMVLDILLSSSLADMTRAARGSLRRIGERLRTSSVWCACGRTRSAATARGSWKVYSVCWLRSAQLVRTARPDVTLFKSLPPCLINQN